MLVGQQFLDFRREFFSSGIQRIGFRSFIFKWVLYVEFMLGVRRIVVNLEQKIIIFEMIIIGIYCLSINIEGGGCLGFGGQFFRRERSVFLQVVWFLVFVIFYFLAFLRIYLQESKINLVVVEIRVFFNIFKVSFGK